MRISKKSLIIVAVLLFVPILILYLVSFTLYGNVFEMLSIILSNRNQLTFSAEAYPTLSETIDYMVAGYSIVVTGIFSYVVWRTSVQSYEVAEAVKKLEENRDKEMIRQGALISYYELLTGFSNLRELFISVNLENSLPNPKRMFFSDDWVKNISTLRDKLTPTEINEVHKIYNRFLTLKSLLETEVEREKLKTVIDDIISESFSNFFPKELLKIDYGNIMKYLKSDYYIILSKIRVSSYTLKEINTTKFEDSILISISDKPVYSGKVSNNLYEGKGVLYTEEGFTKYEGIFEKGKFVSGKAMEYYENGDILYEMEYQNGTLISGCLMKAKDERSENPNYFIGEMINNKIYTGYTTEFYNNKILYEGFIKERQYSGQGTLYKNGRKILEGIFIEGSIVKGRKFDSPSFEGEFKNDRPWIGTIKGYSDKIIYDFEGHIIDGQPYEGSGLVFLNDYKGETRDYREFLEESRNLDFDIMDQLSKEEIVDIEENQQAQLNKSRREEYDQWENFIQANWIKGQIKEKENKEGNIEVLVIQKK